jgi:hypothetical protein
MKEIPLPQGLCVFDLSRSKPNAVEQPNMGAPLGGRRHRGRRANVGDDNVARPRSRGRWCVTREEAPADLANAGDHASADS